jgi:pyruvate formate lyase activating enzyme
MGILHQVLARFLVAFPLGRKAVPCYNVPGEGGMAMIAGLQKMTLLDFPGKVACTLFLQGCNFRCPFCHNSELIPRQGEKLMDMEAFLAFLEKRKGMLDGVCVSGGEPTLCPELEELLGRIKALGFAVKLDTNGSRPDVLKALVAKGLVDYVAMDVKNSPSCYPKTLGFERYDMAPVEESLRFLMEGNVDYELRTTVVSQLHNAASIEEMGAWLSALLTPKKPRQLWLQFFTDRDTVLFSGLTPPTREEMEAYCSILTPHVEKIAIRGD